MGDFVLEPGHLVTHKSAGSPEMVVEDVVEAEDGRTKFRCGWFDREGRFRRDDFHLHELVLVQYISLGDGAEAED